MKQKFNIGDIFRAGDFKEDVALYYTKNNPDMKGIIVAIHSGWLVDKDDPENIMKQVFRQYSYIIEWQDGMTHHLVEPAFPEKCGTMLEYSPK